MKALLLVSLLALPVASFADTSYNVNLSSADYTVTGTITTDGALGVLSTGDILSYDLTITSGAQTDSFTTGGYGITGSDLSATSSGLFYDFSDPNFSYAGFGDAAIDNALCFGDNGGCFSENGFSGISVRINDTDFQEPALDSLTQVATVASTPEPDSLMLLGSALLGLVPLARRRFRR